ncbi:MAG TPA: hypothetical protein VHV27_11000 [Phenylobacterium sp.]|jgi:tetratricopeptide (TPR) repeat protein|nr:hypothetical protein [Phenylobacterium sp.]
MRRLFSSAAAGAFAGALFLAGQALAGGIADGNAGLEALNRGANDEAIRLFTRALADKHLAHDDREFAYVSRAKAYQAKGDATHAAADLRSALKLKPDDDNVRDELQAMLGKPVRPPTELDAALQPPREPWGFFAATVGKYYWYEVPGQDPHLAYYHSEWVSQGQVLAAAIRNKRGPAALFEIKLDPATGKLMEANIVSAGAYYSTADASRDGVVNYAYFQDKPLRTTWRLQPDGAVSAIEEQFKDGTWTMTTHAQLVEATEDELQAAGLIKKNKRK